MEAFDAIQADSVKVLTGRIHWSVVPDCAQSTQCAQGVLARRAGREGAQCIYFQFLIDDTGHYRA